MNGARDKFQVKTPSQKGDGFILRTNGMLVNKDRAVELRREIAYLEAVLPPRVFGSCSPSKMGRVSDGAGLYLNLSAWCCSNAPANNTASADTVL